MAKLTLIIDQSLLAVVKLTDMPPNLLSDKLTKAKFFTFTKTRDELSLVIDQNLLDNIVTTDKIEKDFIRIYVSGPLDFSLTGIMLSIIQPLAKVNISVFTISSYNTDHILIKVDKIGQAIAVLCQYHDIRFNI